MATWMLSAAAAAAALGAVGLLAERGMSRLGRATRWTWLAILVASAVWPFLSGALPGPGMPGAIGAVVSTVGSAGSGAPVDGSVAPTGLAGGVTDLLLLGAWGLASAALLTVLLLSAGTLKGRRRRWRRGTVAGHRVFLSAGSGPAAVGLLRPRVVLPSWVLELEPTLRRLVVAHEREHVRAGDGRLLGIGLLLLVLLPWCLPLWWQFHRLRAAIETDCDRRLLRAGASPRDYARVLLSVARRRRRTVVPLAAMISSKTALERRLREITAGPARGPRRLAVAPLAGAALLALGTAAVPLPDPPSPAALATSLRSSPPAPRAGGETLPRPDGSLPGDPGEERLAAAIGTHHADAVASGLPAGSIIWFIVDREGAVLRTGVERGTEREVTSRLRARYPAETSARGLAFEGVPAGAGEAHVIWLLPEP